MNTVTDTGNANGENLSCYDCNSIHDGKDCYNPGNKTQDELEWNEISCTPEQKFCKVGT